MEFQHLHYKNRMNKKEIELHYLPYSIYGTDVLGFHHSIKSTETSLSRTDVLGFHHSTKSIETSSSYSDTKWWLVSVGVVVDMAQDGWPPPIVASSVGSRCSSRDGALGWCRPLGGVGTRCSHAAVMVQSVAHSN